MKQNFILGVLISLFFGVSVSAQPQTIGRLLSKGADCGIVDVVSGHLVSASGQKHLVIETSIQNLDFSKRIWVSHSNGQGAEAKWTPSWWDYSVAAQLNGQDGQRDYITIRDQMVGEKNNYTIAIYVKMQGQEYSCTDIQIGE